MADGSAARSRQDANNSGSHFLPGTATCASDGHSPPGLPSRRRVAGVVVPAVGPGRVVGTWVLASDLNELGRAAPPRRHATTHLSVTVECDRTILADLLLVKLKRLASGCRAVDPLEEFLEPGERFLGQRVQKARVSQQRIGRLVVVERAVDT